MTNRGDCDYFAEEELIAEFAGISKEKTTLEKGGHAHSVKKPPAEEKETKEKEDDKEKVSH